MKKGYWVVAYRSISDESAVKKYAALARPALESFGARLLTSSTGQIRTHDSEAYQKALQALGSGAERDFRIIEGV